MRIEETITIPLKEYNALKQQVADMAQQVSDMNKVVDGLRDAIALSGNSRKSGTSSMPPSQDLQRPNSKSLRTRSGLRPCGQKGHGGSTLEMTDIPDRSVDHRPSFCRACGKEFSDEVFSLAQRRQEVVLPPIVPLYVEHLSYGCTCGRCGTANTGDLPSHLKGNI